MEGRKEMFHELIIDANIRNEVKKLLQENIPYSEERGFRLFGPLKNFPGYFVKVLTEPEEKLDSAKIEIPVEIDGTLVTITTL